MWAEQFRKHLAESFSAERALVKTLEDLDRENVIPTKEIVEKILDQFWEPIELIFRDDPADLAYDYLKGTRAYQETNVPGNFISFGPINIGEEDGAFNYLHCLLAELTRDLYENERSANNILDRRDAYIAQRDMLKKLREDFDWKFHNMINEEPPFEEFNDSTTYWRAMICYLCYDAERDRSISCGEGSSGQSGTNTIRR